MAHRSSRNPNSPRAAGPLTCGENHASTHATLTAHVLPAPSPVAKTMRPPMQLAVRVQCPSDRYTYQPQCSPPTSLNGLDELSPELRLVPQVLRVHPLNHGVVPAGQYRKHRQYRQYRQC